MSTLNERVGEITMLFAKIINGLAQNELEANRVASCLESIVHGKDMLWWGDMLDIIADIKKENVATAMFKSLKTDRAGHSGFRTEKEVREAVELGTTIVEKSSTLIYYAVCGCCDFKERLQDLRSILHDNKQLKKVVIIHHQYNLFEWRELPELFSAKNVTYSTISIPTSDRICK